MNKPYNIQNTNICNGIFHISFFKAQLINEGETTGISKDKNVMARTRKYYLKKLFDLEVKGQSPTKVITVCDTPPYGHAPTYQI
jgi:hypothetical protein